MQSRALEDIEHLADFYDIELKHPRHDIDLELTPDTVDDYMEALGDAWGSGLA